ncbi:MAG: hypothetical protein V1846_05055 [Candidatus Komeilibacteria bacterium]
MYLTVHAAVGTLIASQTNSPLVAFVGGFVSHFILDFIPHGDEEVYDWYHGHMGRLALILLLDLSAFILYLSLVRPDLLGRPIPFVYWVGIGGAVLPDFIAGLTMLAEAQKRRSSEFITVLALPQLAAAINKLHFSFHQYLTHHWKIRIGVIPGIIWQIIILCVIGIWLK